MKLISIIIVNYNLTENVKHLLKSIKEHVKDIDYEIIVVDNNSPDRSIESLVQEFPSFRFKLLNTNYGFGHGNNIGAAISEGRYLLLLNPDTYLINNLALDLFDFAEKHPNFGIIGPQLNYPDGTFQVSAARFPNLKQEIAYALGILYPTVSILNKIKNKVYKSPYYEVDFVFGSCMFIRKEVFNTIGGFDEKYFLITEETDFCYVVKKRTNYQIIYWQGARLIHLKSQITGKNKALRLRLAYKSKLRFFKKHYSKERVLILKYFIIIMFSLKRILLFGSKKPAKEYRETYLSIIRYYSNPESFQL